MKVKQTLPLKLCYLVGVIGFLGTLPSCDALDDIIGPTLVTVRLVNTGDFPVEVELYYDDEQLTPEVLLTEIGQQLEFTVPAGETTTFSRSCDDLQALIIEDADLNIIGGLGPETNTGVLRDGDDFNCGSTITFTFAHSAEIFDFDVNYTVN